MKALLDLPGSCGVKGFESYRCVFAIVDLPVEELWKDVGTMKFCTAQTEPAVARCHRRRTIHCCIPTSGLHPSESTMLCSAARARQDRARATRSVASRVA